MCHCLAGASAANYSPAGFSVVSRFDDSECRSCDSGRSAYRHTGLKAIVFRTEKLVDFTKFLETKNVQFESKLKPLSESGMLATMIRDPDENMINVLQYGKSSPHSGSVST